MGLTMRTQPCREGDVKRECGTDSAGAHPRGVLPKCKHQGNGVHGRIDGCREFAGYDNFSCCCDWSGDRHRRAPSFGQHARKQAEKEKSGWTAFVQPKVAGWGA